MKILPRLLFAIALLTGPAARAATMPPDMADLAARLMPSVVSIASTEPAPDDSNAGNGDDDQSSPGDNGGDDNGPDDQGDQGDQGSVFHVDRTADAPDATGTVLPPPKAEEALGSGFIFDPNGYILTNNHVISGATSVTVTFQDGTILPAVIIGRDKDGDLAVLKVDAGHKLPALQFGDSSKLRVGDWVLAIGNPFGLSGSASAGIVSALDRNISEDKFDDFIQTDATINRGNSGGPLFDLSGHVIGVNAAIYSPSGGSVGIGFAIPAAMAQPVAESLKNNGQMIRGWLGVATQDVTPEIAESLDLPAANGALIGGTTPLSPADSKLQPGDVVVSLAGIAIKDPRGLMIRTAEIPVGQPATAEFWRNGDLLRTSLTVAVPPAAPDNTETAPAAPSPGNVALPDIGLSVASIPAAAGVTVMAVAPNGPAGKAGLVAENVIEQVAGAPVGSAGALRSAVQYLARTHKAVAVLLVSGYMPDGSDPGPRWVPVTLK